MCSRSDGRGRDRNKMTAGDGSIILLARRNWHTKVQKVASEILAATARGQQISRKSVARSLRGRELCVHKPILYVPLTRQQRTAHLQECREHRSWTKEDYEWILFSNVSRFSLSTDCRHQLISRECGTAYRVKNIQKRD